MTLWDNVLVIGFDYKTVPGREGIFVFGKSRSFIHDVVKSDFEFLHVSGLFLELRIALFQDAFQASQICLFRVEIRLGLIQRVM